MRKGTVCFLQKDNQLLLALIQYSPTDRRWTGIGGFVEEGESLEDAVVREVSEETYISIDKKSLVKVAELDGEFQLNVFLTNKWTGDFKIKDPSLKELKWFDINELPFSQMHPGTEKYLPKVISGKLIKIAGNKVTEVSRFD